MRISSHTSVMDATDSHSIAYLQTSGSGSANRQHARSYVVAQADHVDWFFVLLVGLLATLGLVMVFSASIALSERLHENAIYFGRNQAVFLSVGLCAAAIAWNVPLQFWERVGPLLLVGGFVSLCLVLIPGLGKSVNGAQRWIDLGISVQPSEFFKLAVVIYLASYFVRKGEQIRHSFPAFAIPLGIAAGASFLLLLEPDFGATVVVAATVMAMMFIAGVKLRHFFFVFAAFIPLALALVYASPYRRTRLLSFVNPWDDPFATDFQLTQALIAIGRGSFDGVGLGNSVQKMAYLPEPHTDFVFAVMAEELGIIGVTIVLGLFAMIVARCFRVARNAERAGHLFAAHMTCGIGFWLGIQAFINVGANMGVLPTKGITLPLFSYGGTSILVVCFACGLILRAHREVAEHTTAELRKSVEARLDAARMSAAGKAVRNV